MARSETTKKTTRIQRQKTDVILEAALDVFSDFGFRGSTIDMIANRANLSKPIYFITLITKKLFIYHY